MTKRNYRKWLYLLIISCLVIISICLLFFLKKGKKPSNDNEYSDASLGSYVFETDWQYYMTANGNFNPKIQETSNGCVFVHNSFVYRYEQGGSILPLCSNANCLHEQEKDPEKRKECHAYLDYAEEGDADRTVVLMKYKDDLFVRYNRSDHDPDSGDACLMKIPLDGASKDILIRANDIKYPLVHRGYLYFYSVEYSVADEESQNGDADNKIMPSVGFHRINLEKKRLKDELIYYREGDHGCFASYAFGNCIWFSMIGNQGSKLTNKIYNIETNQTEDTEISPPVQAYQGKYYQKPYDAAKGDLDMTVLVQADIYGKPEKNVLEDIEQLSNILSDGKYLYICNTQIHQAYPEIEEECRVYDENFQLVDKFKLPDTGNLYVVPIGGEKNQYVRYSDEESGEWGLLVFDKSRIGTIQGDYCPYSFIRYGAEGTDPEPFIPKDDSVSPSEEIQIPDSTLNQEVSLTYTEPEDEIVTGKLKNKKYLDSVSGNHTDCQVFLSVDRVKAVMTPSTSYDPGNGGIVIGRCYTRVTTLYGYYTKGKETYARKVTMTSVNAEEPVTVEIELPEDGDEFIGVKAVTEADYLTEYWTPPPKEGPYNPNASRTEIGSSKEPLTCYEGKVEESAEKSYEME